VVDPKMGKRLMELLSSATEKGLVRSCHDCSEGGLAVATAEMSFAGGYGMELDLSLVPIDEGVDRDDIILFSESNTRFIVEVQPQNQKELEDVINGIPYGRIGRVVENDVFTVLSQSGKKIISEKIYDLKEAWQATLRL
jgi:phosphoribosylformylglycinamidine synthase